MSQSPAKASCRRFRAAKTMDKKPLGTRLKRDFRINWSLYLLVLPVIAFYIIFHYVPLYGAQIAFKDFSPTDGITGSEWAGLKHFQRFFQGSSVGRVVTNTFLISFYELIFSFPAPIILALALNELRWPKYKRTVQTISYLPHFISMVVVVGMIKDFTATYGLFNDVIEFFGGRRVNMLSRPQYFRPIYVISGIWQGIGWNSIIYIAALSGINSELYEAASIDGAGRWRRMLNVTLPGIAPTIIILLILRIGQMLNVGYEKIILLYNPSTYSTGDVISSYVYRVGLLERSYSYSTAVGLMNSVVNFVFVFAANMISRKVTETSLW